ncbi:phosphate ABC transporter membrane protein 2 (PhoT family) [Nitrosomonas nitrosa]|jgi:phosphate transport system permease protein|uniref:Phosphate transport system permease protein PstA n=1 Tax=Nitrosomonas nitrosa TaxID=52442 RepID=A0A1I4U5V1_9PROT|nr:phosphate ABC transporter permease PstA [Nitrosomonas nitrosa]PTQ90552.1 phosphate ABC transporter membrane protein 2 (PhoT family) [Nitrosomonas nitrosa]SFM84220.1 phosphate ABC transporter membrane protein 2, PhoT family [Nitrosomonas nitrosa]HNP51658.1 phosphate ABC transporter permease PstA [Nitrosomonas nitrosa]
MSKLFVNKDKMSYLLRDLTIQVLIYSAIVCVSGVFLWILFDLIRGGSALLSWQFLTDVPRDAGRAGGISSILASTLLVLLIALLAALPISWATAILLTEFISAESPFGRWVRYSLQVLACVPSIIFGLFGYAFFSLYLGLGFSILSGGLTLACMLLPILVSTAEAGLRAVPESYRLSAVALGMSRAATLFHVLLPVAAPAWAAGLLLGIGRAAAETAALMFTSGYVDRMPESLLDSGRVLALHIFDLSMNVPGGDAPAFASALVLILLLLVINLVAMRFTYLWQRKKLNAE